jgi:hypothetical protein
MQSIDVYFSLFEESVERYERLDNFNVKLKGYVNQPSRKLHKLLSLTVLVGPTCQANHSSETRGDEVLFDFDVIVVAAELQVQDAITPFHVLGDV